MKSLKKHNLEEGAVRIIGPQLGLCNEPNTVLITIALTHKNAPKELSCVLLTPTGEEIIKTTVHSADNTFNNFLFKFDRLKPNQKYFYKFFDTQEHEIPLEGGLYYTECWFYGPSFNDNTDKFVLLSCNNPFQSGYKESEKQFAMWKRLNELIDDHSDIRLIIQGGDQVYHDQIEQPSLKTLLGKEEDPEAKAQVTEQIIRNYQRFYANLDYRKILARIPSVAMLDDHDITDGWGGRDESVDDKGEFLKHWSTYFQLTYAAFKAFQAIKNPNPIHENAATTYLDIGNNRIFLMDYRAEKNFFKKVLLTTTHENKVLDLIKSTDKRIFFLSPVVPARIDPEVEESLGRGAKLARGINKKLKEHLDNRKLKADQWEWWTKILKALYVVTGTIAAYSDDIYDSLSSSVNKPYFLRLIAALRDSHRLYKREILILSGDIHTGGISEIFVEGENLTIPQIVSSPIGYEPMNKIVKGMTTTEKDPFVSNEDIRVRFRNIFFRSDRNFAVITPSRLRHHDGIEFHFEHLSEPIISPAYFSPQVTEN